MSKDLSRVPEYEKLLQGECKFLDQKSEMIGNRVAFSSFPRTGNSFLRKIIEQITGVFTGSDMPIAMTLPFQQQGLLGEETYDNSVWITKTHYPQD